MFLFSTCVFFGGNLKLTVRLAAKRKSLRKFNSRPVATACRSVWPGLKDEGRNEGQGLLTVSSGYPSLLKRTASDVSITRQLI